MKTKCQKVTGKSKKRPKTLILGPRTFGTFRGFKHIYTTKVTHKEAAMFKNPDFRTPNPLRIPLILVTVKNEFWVSDDQIR